MDNSSIYKTIRETVSANIPGARVLLFGSRARGEEDRFSDYDLMVITQQTFGPKEKIRLSTLLNHAIVGAIDPLDINVYAVQAGYTDSNLFPLKEEAESYYNLALQIKSLITERIILS